jgi:hypothetical protein
MQLQTYAMALTPSTDRRGLAVNERFASVAPPFVPRTSRGLSGRPTCRIYARSDVWVLELDPQTGGWLDAEGKISRRLTFPSLAAAIGYAERHGLDYRIERPSRPHKTKRTKPMSVRLPRSWLARLARNGCKGDIYHG